jgi:hypothetical protein
MSAGAVGMLAPEPVRVPSGTTRPSLHLVGPDEHAGSDNVCAPALHAKRLTRRGRLAITMVVTLAVAALALVLTASVDAAAPQIDHATTVTVGQTLSEVAATQLPRLTIHDAVARIQLVNGLNTSQVHAGQLLLIPALP